jgi:uncharacterized DUF497 family protein
LTVDVEWDPGKAKLNLRKHGVDFVDAAVALEDELALTVLDPESVEGKRFISLCRDPGGQVLVVVYTWRGPNIRVISARGATRREVRQYEEGA